MPTLDMIDTDSHLSEPPDLWTLRLDPKWRDVAPRVIFDEKAGFERWVVGNRKLTGVAGFACAGYSEHPPKFPKTQAEADPAAFDAKARLAKLDKYGIYAQALYPNLLAFMTFAFRQIKDPAFALDCVRVYNDFLMEFAEVAPDRFIGLCALPFWDVEESVKELDRAHKMGHRGVLFIGKPYKLGLPTLEDPHWEPLLKEVEARDLSLNFHTGFSEFDEAEFLGQLGRNVTRADYVKTTALSQLGLAETLGDLTTSGVCVKYPKLKMVLVESGVGWLRYYLEQLDWQWTNSGAHKEYPDREYPSFYFERQMYGSFWFERESMSRIADLYPDNLMFETDFPHPTSLSPGPISSSSEPRQMAAESMKDLDPVLQQKLLYGNAAKLYHIKGA
jgi:predicted TIM-barrel fold metal-dependent hydrolase